MAADEKWYFTKEQLANTPSRKCGIDADKELSYRQQAANFIQDMGQRLAVSQLCINTAIVYMHRFYVFHSLSQFHRNAIAAAALFLAAKVEEQPRKLEHVIKVAYMCLHRDPNQTPPDTKSEQYLEQAQDLVFNENVLLQTLGFDVAIDHPHTHVVRCCQLVKASKDLAQTSYFMASNSLHLTTMCLQYKPTVVACFCIHLACKWSNWEIPQSNEGKHWFWYVDRSVTSELLQQLTAEFLHIFDKCPSRLKRKIMSISANQSPSINHPSLPNSPFDAEPRKVQSPAMTSDGGPTFQSSRPFHSEKQEDKKQTASVSGRPPVDFREYREKKERERIEREKAVASTAATVQGHVTDSNKHHSHHHKPVSGVAVPNKHPAPSGQKTALHHNHHHRPEVKVGQPVPQRHSSNSQPRDPNRDPNRQRLPREYNSNSGTSGGTMFSHGHPTHPSKDAPVDNSLADSSVNRSDSGISQESISHNNPQEKLSNNNHSIHRLSAADCKHQPHDKRAYDPRHKPSLEHRKDGEQKPYAKYPDPLRLERQRKPDTLEQRSEEVRKLIEKPLPVPKPRSEVQKEEYIANMLKQSLHSKYNQQDKPQGNPVVVLNEIKMASVGQNTLFNQEKSPNAPVSAATQMSQKLPIPKPVSNQHSVHGVSLILKDTVKNGNSQSSLNNVEDPKAEKRPRHEDLDRSSSSLQHNSLQIPPAKHRSLFSPEKTPTTRESSHPQRSKSKQKTPPAAAKVPKQQERLPDPLMNLNLVSPFASPPPGPPQQNPSPPKRVANDVTTTSHKRHRTSSNSETEQPVKVKTEDMSNFEAMMLGRVPELIQPIRDSLTSTNGRGTSVANDLKPPELIRPFEPEPVVTQMNMMSQQQMSVTHQQPLMNGMDLNMTKQESHETRVKHENLKTEVPGVEYTPIKLEYLSPMKSAQSISALLQEPLASMPSLLQGMQQFSQIVQQQVHQEQSQQQQLSQSLLLHDQQLSMQTQCSSLPVIGEANVVSTVDISALNTPVQGATEMTTGPITVSVPTLILPAEEKKLEHHKSEKKKKKEKHKHKDKDKSKEKRKHKHKDKEKQREKDKTEESVGSAVPIRITIPKDKLNLSTEQAAHTAIAVPPSLPISGKNKSPQGTGLKIKIPKERLKGTDGVSSSPAQPVIQAPLKITIRTDAISRSGGAAVGDFLTENRKRERDQNSSPTTSGPPSKKHTQSSNYTQQRPAERQNGRHYNSSSNNKVRGGGRGGRQFSTRVPPPPYGQALRDNYYQHNTANHEQDSYNSHNVRNSHHPSMHPPPPPPPPPPPSSATRDVPYSRAPHASQSQADSFFFANYRPPSLYNHAGYMYDPAIYYQQYQQQYSMYPTGNVIMTPDGAIDTSVPPPSLPPNIRQQTSQQNGVPQLIESAEPNTPPPPLPSEPPPNSPPPPPPPE